MARHKLSESNLKRLDKPGVYGDGDGLWLRVRKGGSKQWFFIWKRAGQRTEIGLGGYGQGTAPVSLALAREKADAIRERGKALRENPELVELITAEKWNGSLPTQMIPGSAVPFVNLGK